LWPFCAAVLHLSNSDSLAALPFAERAVILLPQHSFPHVLFVRSLLGVGNGPEAVEACAPLVEGVLTGTVRLGSAIPEAPRLWLGEDPETGAPFAALHTKHDAMVLMARAVRAAGDLAGSLALASRVLQVGRRPAKAKQWIFLTTFPWLH
jgi:hypothetical protein